ncbi:hypothetical protein PBRA_005303 [Plasmodiophora brassicae]|uniref:Calponin-homology (CH) domain-containing protein n=1 Tax=Plasmodiophora brassicae TaxID=37360 RepID=A0A0G4INE5_PLABS|nr:hypothetical protein PBRA_005303 [Plasmodiophora brassicae]
MGEGVAACAVDVGAAEAPPPETDAIMDAAGACLRLEGFAPPTFVEFGRVRVGTSSRKSLTIVNPGRSALSVVIDPIADPAFQLDRTVLDVAECGGRADVFITWSPTEGNPDGKNVRVSLSLRSNSRQKFKVVLTGASVRGSHDPRRGTRPRRKWNSTKAKPSRNNFVDENVDDNSVVATEPVMSTGKGVAWTADLEAPLSRRLPDPATDVRWKTCEGASGHPVASVPTSVAVEGACETKKTDEGEGDGANVDSTKTLGNEVASVAWSSNVPCDISVAELQPSNTHLFANEGDEHDVSDMVPGPDVKNNSPGDSQADGTIHAGTDEIETGAATIKGRSVAWTSEHPPEASATSQQPNRSSALVQRRGHTPKTETNGADTSERNATGSGTCAAKGRVIAWTADLGSGALIPSQQPKRVPTVGQKRGHPSSRTATAQRSDTSGTRSRKAHVSKAMDQVDEGKAPVSTATVTKHRSRVSSAITRVKHGQQSGYHRQLAYDEQWMEKQTTGFVAWVNFVFKQREFPESFISERETNTTFTTAAERRAHAHLLQRAFYFYRSHPVQTIISRLEKAVSEGQLRIRDDIQMLNDLGLRDRFVGILSSYHNAWLRLALETVYGEFLAKSLCLRHFIQTRLLSNAEIDREHAYMYTPQGQPFFTEAHQPAMRSFVLKKFLQLVLFLDMAKTQNVFPVSPRLFNTTGTIKSTKAVLFEFSAVFMAGMGDFARAIFLSCGYECAASQSPLDEFDFSVKDLGNDFRDGVRLCALADRPEIFKKVLLPAVNTTRKKHNVGLAMQAFFDQGISLNSCPADEIVSGNREHTLDLLWRVAIQLRIPALVDAATLFWESRLIERDLTKDRLFAKANLGSPPIMYPNCPQLQCILRWCMAICAHYDVPIFNFTSSFADGRAFAFLIHYYYPQLVRREDIRGARPAHDDTVLGESADRLSNDMPWADFIDVSLPFEGSSVSLEAERSNFRLVSSAVKELGCIPMLVPIPGSNSFRSAPDEKVVVIFLSYLSARLVTLSQEAHAARKIQKAWRALRISRMTSRFYGSAVVVQAGLHTVLLGRIQAARHIIMAALKSYSLSVGARARCIATVTLGAVLANCRPCRDIQKHMAVRTLQASLLSSSFAAHVKRCIAQRRSISVHRIQRAWRGYRTRATACRSIQAFFRAWQFEVHHKDLYRLRQARALSVIGRSVRTFLDTIRTRRLLACIALQSCVSSHSSVVLATRLSQLRYRCRVHTVQRAIRRYLNTLRCRRLQSALALQAAFSSRHYVHGHRRLWASRLCRAVSVVHARGRLYLEAVTMRRLLSCQLIQSGIRSYATNRTFTSVLTFMRHRYIVISQRRARQFVHLVRHRRSEACRTLQATLTTLRVQQFAVHQVDRRYKRQIAHVQHRARLFIAMCRTRRWSACESLQASFKTVQASRSFSTLSARRHARAVTTLQRHVRAWRHRAWERRLTASTTLQAGLAAVHETWRAARLLQLRKQVSARSVVRVMVTFAQARSLRKLNASLVLQSSLRALSTVRMSTRLASLRQMMFAVVIQRRARVVIEQRRRRRCMACIALQSAFGALRFSRTAHQQLSHRRLRHILVCQRAAARFVCRARDRRLSACMSLQSAFRSMRFVSCMLRRVNLRSTICARRIQEKARLFIARCNERRISSASTLQGALRSLEGAQTFSRLNEMRMHRSIILIQRCIRRHLCRVRTRRSNAVSVVEDAIETYLCIRNAKVLVSLRRSRAARILCDALRRFVFASQQRRLQASIALQATLSSALHARRCAMLLTAKHHRASAVLCRFFRRCRARRRLMAASIAQAGLNAWLVPNWCQKRLAFRRSSAIALIGQRCVRAVQLRRRVSSGLSIAQAALSTFIAMNNARLALASLICIQSAMRTAAAVQGFSTTVRAIVRVQSRWRGLRERRRATAKVAAARQRIEDAASRWTIELTVGYRTRAALDILLSGSKLSAVMHACRTLEVTTRTLAGCADDTVQNDAVPVLYALMQSLNRSKPHLELLQCALNILVNLSNNASTTAAVYQADACVDVMLELLQTQRDNGELFTKATQLLSRGCCSTAPGFARRLQSGSKRLSSIHGILSRKLEMQVRYQPSSRVAAKQTAALRRSVESIEELLRLVNDPPRE